MTFAPQGTTEASASIKYLKLLNQKYLDCAPRLDCFPRLKELWVTESALCRVDGAALPSQLCNLQLYDNHIATVTRLRPLKQLEV